MADETLHASCVAGPQGALLILGAPGVGKSATALRLIALGATLVADDRVVLRCEGARLHASAPPALAGLIEARGLGLMRLPALAEAPVLAVLDLDRAGSDRLPLRRTIALCGAEIALILRFDSAMPAALWTLLCHGLPIDPDAPLDPLPR